MCVNENLTVQAIIFRKKLTMYPFATKISKHLHIKISIKIFLRIHSPLKLLLWQQQHFCLFSWHPVCL